MSYAEYQRSELRKWKLWPKHQHLTQFSTLLENEFIHHHTRRNNLNNRLAELVRYCATTVPYYRAAFAQHDIDVQSFSGMDNLKILPIIDRATIKDNSDQLQSTQLPVDQSLYGFASTSGSTGQPIKVLHTDLSIMWFSILKQREYRSWGFNPAHAMAVVRPAVDLPRPSGELINAKSSFTLGGWQYVDRYFQTGDMVMLPDTSGTDYIVEWLQGQSASYIMAMAAVLEQIALGFTNTEHRSKLVSAVSISQQLTNGMRSLVEQHVAPSVHQNYGLNEIGLVAMQCPESGQYHVHNENCLIEIVDSNGEPCEPGKPGKLLVTALQNLAMPLLRYDTDDLAEYPSEQCPCGRSMQSFMNLQGRYRRTAHLPAGTWDYWDGLLRVFGQASAEEMSTIKQYQLHQLAADNFSLKLKVDGTISQTLKTKIHQKWRAVAKGKPAKLTILELDKIEQPGKKFQNFISDVTPQD
ncbi:phenylacetate--CoA ligase family protein [Arenicella xantha]|uniref:Phenylacetate-CoA ligase n=1 Tax=Arenicella xantha TaxID=644221 RepID=A0A395JML7_9GAMM|nr:AMP-binding protein [Arenicella xantha]RBP52870.1 phenylacetate-CoA ligase [Arenicella xantha]